MHLRSGQVRFLRRAARIAGDGGRLLLGVDLDKDPRVLERAYDDPEGVTARFNRNLLVRINRELGADFDVGRFEHRAHYDEEHGRIEMHLVSRVEQWVRVVDRRFRFARGETVCTEHSHKFSIEGFVEEAAAVGFGAERVWTDEQRLFCVALLSTAPHLAS